MSYRSDVIVAVKKWEVVNFNLHLAQAEEADHEAKE